jgi:phage shock protein A
VTGDPEKLANASLHQRAALMDEIERLQEALATCRALRALDVREIERLRGDILDLRALVSELRDVDAVKAADEIDRLRALRQRQDHDLSDAEDLLLEIANSMEKDFIDPVAHIDWCMNAAKKYLIERAARVKR